MATERILVVDDEPGVRSALEAILGDEGFQVSTAETGEDALAAVEGEAFDAVLLDVWLPGIDGLETLRRMRDLRRDVEVVMISGHGTIDTAVRATKFGAFDFVEKPLSLDRTLLVLRNALRQRRLERSNRHLLEQLARQTEILGTSAAAETLRALVATAATTDAPVLICGERGSGRETVARRIHAAGRRPHGPFVEVPCAALDGPAAERAIGGGDGESGRLALARGGALLLKDVGGLPAPVQLRLAATLEAQVRAGADLRLIGSCAAGATDVRPELLQVLDVLRIEVPALRERREDVQPLAERFMDDLSREYGRPAKRLAPDCLAALRAHAWPGNVRELWNLMERVLLVVPDDPVHAADLPSGPGGPSGPSVDLYGDFGSLDEGLRAFERHFIRRALTEENGDESAAARRLGLTREDLERRLRSA